MATILIADDEAPLRFAMQVALSRAGHDVVAVADGREALALLKRHETSFALFICDLVMPDLEGIETIVAARAARPGLPILAISGAADGLLYLQSARALGACHTLRKPFAAEDFLAACHSLLPACSTTA